MPSYTYKCNRCGFLDDFIVGATTGMSEPKRCPSCEAVDSMEKQFSMKGISGEVVGGYEYQYGKKAWKRNMSSMDKASVLAGDKDPY